MNLSNKKILVFDLGIWLEDSVRFARDGAKVWYYVPNRDSFQEPFKGMIGTGMEGIEVVTNFWDYVDKADVIYVPDNTCADVVEFLKRHSYPVAGVGAAEKLEVDRWYGRQKQKEHGLPVQYTLRLKGFSALVELMKNGGKEFGFADFPKEFYVKVDNEYRGIEESFKHIDWESSEDVVYRMASRLGPFKEDIGFTCEELIEGIEPGIDAITWDGELMYPALGSYEGKGVGILERVYQNEQELPKIHKVIHDGLAPEFKKFHTRFFYSTELRVGKDGIPYLIDNTLRKAGPGTSALQCEIIENFTEVCCGLATGEKINPIIKCKYGVAISFESSEAAKGWVKISFPKNLRDCIKLRRACKKGRDYYAIPGFESLGTVVGYGNGNIKSIVEEVREKLGEISAHRIEFEEGGMDHLLESVETGKKRGVSF